MANWWYYYYCRGYDKDKKTYNNEDFALATNKVTPDFFNCKYEPVKCHLQIGQNIQVGSIVVLNTTIGKSNKKRFITGYFTVEEVGGSKPLGQTEGKSTCSPIIMDRNKSLLLLDNPIEIDYKYASKLFSEELNSWKKNSQTLLQNISSKTRNSHLTTEQKRIIMSDLNVLYENGSKNYLGMNYVF